jgi:phosphohistidine phosphatase
MRLTLIRHGEAGDDAPRDEARALTKKGRADVRRVGRALADAGARFDAVISSALVRAVQTAELVAAELAYRGRLTISDQLVPEASPDGVVGLLATLATAGKESVALVAHEPILSGVAARLTGAARFPPLRKAEAIRLRLPDGPAAPGIFRWRIEPDSGKQRRE